MLSDLSMVREKTDSRSLMRILITIIALLGFSLPAMAQSVEKADTSQQAKKQADELQLAREAVKKAQGEQPENNGVGRIIGNYSMMSTIEVGYRFVDTGGSRATYLSDVNVRDGWRLFDYSMDLRSITGTGALFDFLRTDISNAGGDAGQYYTLRVDKTRAYKFDATVRRFNYFRALSAFALDQHGYDLREQLSDYNLKLFPQRRVRVNLSYARTMATGPFTSTYDFERDEFPIIGKSRWAANDYRIGIDTNVKHWNIFFEQMFRNFRDDSTEFTTSFQNGNQAAGSSVLSSFLRLEPARSRARVTRASLSGDITSRGHLVLRALYGSENLELNETEFSSGVDYLGNQIVTRKIIDSARVHRPSTTADAEIA